MRFLSAVEGRLVDVQFKMTRYNMHVTLPMETCISTCFHGQKIEVHDAKLSSCEHHANHATTFRTHEEDHYVNKHVGRGGSWVCVCVSVEFMRHLASLNPLPSTPT